MMPGSLLSGSGRELKGDQLATYARVLREHGGRRVRFRVGPPKVGFVFDAVFRPDDARQVLATEAAHYDKEVPGIEEARRLFGDGHPLQQRRPVAPGPAHRRPAVHQEADLLVRGRDGGGGRAPGRHVDGEGPAAVGSTSPRPARTTPSTSWAGACSAATSSRPRRCSRATVPVLNEYAARRILSPVRLPTWVPTPANRRAERARRALWGQVEGLIAERRAGSLDGDDLLTLLLTARDPEDGSALDDDAVRDQALILLLGGHETTGTTMALALHLLGRHPDVQQRVRDEVAAVVGDRPVTACDDLARLTFTAQVLDETMRLYPPGHTLVRHAHEATTLDGQDVPAGHLVAVSVWGVHHNPDVWPDPERFDPDRFGSEGPAGTTTCRSAAARGAASASTWRRPSCWWRWQRSCGRSGLTSELDEVPLDVGLALRPSGALPCRIEPVPVPACRLQVLPASHRRLRPSASIRR